MYALSALLIAIFAIAITWTLFRQFNIDGVEQLEMRTFGDVNSHWTFLYGEEGRTMCLHTIKSTTSEETTLSYDPVLGTYVLAFSYKHFGSAECRMRALQALANHNIIREGKEALVNRDLGLIRAILTNELEPHYNEYSKDRMNDVHNHLYNYLDVTL